METRATADFDGGAAMNQLRLDLAPKRAARAKRPPIIRASYALEACELVVDNFAGGGGASTGIEEAIGRPVDIAINHDAEAIAMHARNHPETRHYQEDVWKVDPREACGGRPVGLAWFSPACTHFSRAKGAQNPKCEKIRGLAWVVVRWAKAVRPRVIVLENVEEFETWGPLEDGRPCPLRRGETFRVWLGKLEALGYSVEWRSLIAADYGAPTTRKRLYLIARCDGQPIVWPEVTHPKSRWRPAADCIEWSIPCPSIFDRARPLADATMRRIAAGVWRYVLNDPRPFVVPIGGSKASPTLIQTGYGERPGQTPRVPGLDKPLGTLVNGQKHALVAAFLARHFGGMVGSELGRPVPTITAKDHHSLVSLSLGDRTERVRAFLTSYYGTGVGQDARDPLRTVTSHDRFGLVQVDGEPYAIADIGMRMLQPRELFRAQGFSDSYVIDAGPSGPLTKTAQIRLVGNSVSPPVARAIVGANVGAARRVAA